MLKVATYFNVFVDRYSKTFYLKHLTNVLMTQDIIQKGKGQAVKILVRDIYRENPFLI